MIDLSKSPLPAADPPSADPALLQMALAAQKEDYLRLAADFDNFRKRTRRESEQQAAAEKEAFIRDLLPVLDNLERALTCEGAASFARRIEDLRAAHGIAVAWIKRMFDLVDEVERLRAEVRFLRHR